MNQPIEIRGAREITDGELNKYGDPRNGSEIKLWGIIVTDQAKLVATPMKAGRGDVLSFQLRLSTRQDDPIQVSCFGELATVAGMALQHNMRLTVEGRLRKRSQTSGGRTTVFVDVVAWEIGMWDNEFKVHWLQYHASNSTDDQFVEPLPGAQGSTIGAEDLQRSGAG